MRRTGIRISMTVVVLMAAACAPGAAQVAERKVDVAMSDLPAAIKQAVREAFPQGKILAVQKEVEGEDPGQYDIEVQSEGKVYEVEVSPQGVVIEAKAVREATVDEGRKTKDDGRRAGETPAAREGKMPSPRDDEPMKWTSDFGIETRKFATTGKNRFFILEPGYRVVLESKTDKVIITVLDQTKQIGNVLTRVVEERESEDGQLVEVSRNFFAICKTTGDVFYFGEEVDDYKDGKVVGHGGAWRADEEGCRAGIIMPGTVLLGARHYQEMAPNAMDRAEVIADDVTLKTPAGTFKNCIRVKETSPLEPGAVGFKTYAPGIGLIQDEDLLLTAYTKGGGQATKEDRPVKKQLKEDQPPMRKTAGKTQAPEKKVAVKEVAVALQDLPKAVRKTADEQAGEGKITEIVRKQTDGGVVYEVEVTQDGRQRDILISADGKYLGMEADEDGDDDEEDEDEDGDDDEEDEDEDSDDDDEDEDEDGDDDDEDEDEDGDDDDEDEDDDEDDEADDEEDDEDEDDDEDDDDDARADGR